MDGNRKAPARDPRHDGEGSRVAPRPGAEAPQRPSRPEPHDRRGWEAERDRRAQEIRRELEAAGAIGRRHVTEGDPEDERG